MTSPNPQHLAEDKKALRQHAFAARKLAHDQKAVSGAQDLAAYISQSPLAEWISQTDAPLGFYVAAGSEIDPRPMMAQLGENGYKFCLPVCYEKKDDQKDDMVFQQYHLNDPLELGGYGMMKSISENPLCVPEIIFLPVVAFDKNGARLGRGGGHYDRLLSAYRAHKNVRAIGLAFDEQLFDGIPCEMHDERLNAIVTPSGVIVPVD